MRDKPKDIREFLTEASIAAYREHVIEECARVAEKRYRGNIAPALLDDVLAEIAIAIRALKDKP